jgi:hypothetical protein
MFCGLPNFLNTNNAYGVIARTYTDNFHAYASGGTSVDFNAVYIILEDSSLFHSSNKTVIALLNTPQSIGGKVKLKYSNNLERTDKRVTKLIYNGVVVLDNPILPLIILLLSFLWFVFGGIRELVRIWKSV